MMLRPVRITIALGTLLLAGCASKDEIPIVAEEPDMCRSGETYSCIERMGKPKRCFCADKDTLRELLEPDRIH